METSVSFQVMEKHDLHQACLDSQCLVVYRLAILSVNLAHEPIDEDKRKKMLNQLVVDHLEVKNVELFRASQLDER